MPRTDHFACAGLFGLTIAGVAHVGGRVEVTGSHASGGDILFGGFMLGMLALGMVALVAPAWGVWRWRGGWRIAAAIPAAVMALVVLRIVLGTVFDPTSHNLWPFEIVMWGGLSCIWMLVAAIARRLSRAGRA